MEDGNFSYFQLLLFIFSFLPPLSFLYLFLLPLLRAIMFLLLVPCRVVSYCSNSIALELANFHSEIWRTSQQIWTKFS